MSLEEGEEVVLDEEEVIGDNDTGVAVAQVQKRIPKQIGVFKPKKLRGPRQRGRPMHKKDDPCIIPMRVSASLHEILSCEKIPKETYDECMSRIIKERASLRIEIDRLKQLVSQLQESQKSQ